MTEEFESGLTRTGHRVQGKGFGIMGTDDEEKSLAPESVETIEKKNNRNCDYFSGNRQSLEVAAEKAGFASKDSYHRAKSVVDSGDKRLVEMVDTEEISVSVAATVVRMPRQPKQRGRSRTTRRRINQVHRNGCEELRRLLDSGAITPHAADIVSRLPRTEQERIVKDGPRAVTTEANRLERTWSRRSEPTPLTTYFLDSFKDLGIARHDHDLTAWVWNPIAGCRHGCRPCAARNAAHQARQDVDPRHRFDVTFYPKRIGAPLGLRERQGLTDSERRIWVCTVGDLFQKTVDKEHIKAILGTMRDTPEYQYIISTRCPERAGEFDLPSNLWLGGTIDGDRSVERIESGLRDVLHEPKFLDIKRLGFVLPDLSGGID